MADLANPNDPYYAQNPFALRPGESMDAYRTRVSPIGGYAPTQQTQDANVAALQGVTAPTLPATTTPTTSFPTNEPKIRNPITGGLEDNPNYVPQKEGFISPSSQPVPQPAPQVGGAQPLAGTQQGSQYVRIPSPTGDTFFQQSAQGLQAVSDPATFRGLQMGQIPSSPQPQIAGGAQRFAQTIAGQPPQQQIQQPSQPQTPQSPGPLESIGLPSELTATSIDDVVKKISAAFGLPEISAEIKKVDDAYAEELQEANENPWISEGLRVRKVNALAKKYEAKKNGLMEQLRLRNDVVGRAIDVYFKEREFKKDLLFKQLDLDAKKLETPTSTDDIREYEFARQQGFTGTLMDYMKQKGGGAGALSPANIQGTINQITGAFDNEPIVKNFNVSAAGFQTMANIKDNTSNPADDIAMIYQFAKIMDPNSVVREGEYAVVQRYAQSWAQSFGFNAARVFSNTKFLTTQAIQNMKAAANAKFQADKGAYENLKTEYERRIEEAKTGQIGGSLPNYAAGFGVSSGGITSPAPTGEPISGGDPDQVPIGGTYSAGGILYLRVGANEFEPIGSAAQ